MLIIQALNVSGSLVHMLWAIRLLLDRGLTDYELERKDSDFYAFEETNAFEIFLCFEDVTEDCVVSKLKGKISDDDKLILSYKAYRDNNVVTNKYPCFADGFKSLPFRKCALKTIYEGFKKMW